MAVFGAQKGRYHETAVRMDEAFIGLLGEKSFPFITVKEISRAPASIICEKTLLECYQSPLFSAYRAHQPFNANMLRPCPLLDNPWMLSQMVRESGAKSTDYTAPEPAEEAESKCAEAATRWAKASEPLWELSPKKKLSDQLVAEGKSATAWVRD